MTTEASLAPRRKCSLDLEDYAPTDHENKNAQQLVGCLTRVNTVSDLLCHPFNTMSLTRVDTNPPPIATLKAIVRDDRLKDDVQKMQANDTTGYHLLLEGASGVTHSSLQRFAKPSLAGRLAADYPSELPTEADAKIWCERKIGIAHPDKR